ncbi:hypothetical protein [Pseudomonas sp. HMWF021]|uniref:hypothetical protein n=1 Tax=Pseudomonas sp. HMWF021 TaxID=2056857 RepID=UPI000D359E04|nr:hypothetical protein [Pseudomonas sp. HMWF021]PTT27227.1 hypothetical protein DBR18_20260 [Pseudomonas sp. HMWF021]
MNAISREEFNARIETIEVRMDARIDAVSAKIDGFLSAQAERDKIQIERDNTRAERDNTQAERDKTQAERDKRYDLITQEMRKIAEGAQEAARQGATVKANVWAATAVQLIGVVAIVVGAYYANQANMYVAIQTTLAAVQAGKDIHVPKPAALPSPIPIE